MIRYSQHPELTQREGCTKITDSFVGVRFWRIWMNSLMNKFFKIVTDANEGSEQNAVWRLLLFEKFGRKKE